MIHTHQCFYNYQGRYFTIRIIQNFQLSIHFFNLYAVDYYAIMMRFNFSDLQYHFI